MTYTILVGLCLPLAAVIIATVAGALLAPLDMLPCRGTTRLFQRPPRGLQ
jgi:hypothetical protein